MFRSKELKMMFGQITDLLNQVNRLLKSQDELISRVDDVAKINMNLADEMQNQNNVCRDITNVCTEIVNEDKRLIDKLQSVRLDEKYIVYNSGAKVHEIKNPLREYIVMYQNSETTVIVAERSKLYYPSDKVNVKEVDRESLELGWQ